MGIAQWRNGGRSSDRGGLAPIHRQRVQQPLLRPAHLGYGLSSSSKMLRHAEEQQGAARSLVRVNATTTVTSTGKVMYRDEENEEARKYRRTVYDFQAWAHHRSVERYRLHLISMPKSRNLKSLWTPVVAVGVISFIFCAYEQALADGLLPASMPDLAQPALPLQLTSFALALLLVFRTNSAYGRWWEARKIWGGLLNRSRDIVRQALTFFQPTNVAGKEAFGRWMCAYTVALEAHLRDPRDATVDPTQIAVLTPEEQQLLNTAAHKPNMCLQVLSQLVDSEPGVDMCRAAEVHQNLTFFHDVTGKCERILRTPIPLSYTRHTTRFLMIWLALLPIGLWNSLHWATVPGDLLIAFLLLGIDEIAIQIEEPFGILPLEALCDRVQIDVQALLKQDDSVREYATMANSASNGGRALPKNIGLGNGNGGRVYTSGHIPAAVDQPWVSSQGAAAANADQN